MCPLVTLTAESAIQMIQPAFTAAVHAVLLTEENSGKYEEGELRQVKDHRWNQTWDVTVTCIPTAKIVLILTQGLLTSC